MITRLRENFPAHHIVEEDAEQLYVVDFKQINNGGVELLNADPGVGHVYLDNERRVPIFFDGFPENAFVITPGLHHTQCECVIFPQACGPDDWIPVIETKYVYDIENAFRKTNDYPNCMIDQIIGAVSYLREKGIIEPHRRVNAIVSFPTLIEDFSASFFAGRHSIEDILIDQKIKIRPTNKAIIKSEQRIKI